MQCFKNPPLFKGVQALNFRKHFSGITVDPIIKVPPDGQTFCNGIEARDHLAATPIFPSKIELFRKKRPNHDFPTLIDR